MLTRIFQNIYTFIERNSGYSFIINYFSIENLRKMVIFLKFFQNMMFINICLFDYLSNTFIIVHGKGSRYFSLFFFFYQKSDTFLIEVILHFDLYLKYFTYFFLHSQNILLPLLVEFLFVNITWTTEINNSLILLIFFKYVFLLLYQRDIFFLITRL